MVCSTAAQSAMRVTLSVSHPVSLKLLSLQALRNDRESLNQLLAVPGLRRYLSNYWWLLGEYFLVQCVPGSTVHVDPDMWAVVFQAELTLSWYAWLIKGREYKFIEFRSSHSAKRP